MLFTFALASFLLPIVGLSVVGARMGTGEHRTTLRNIAHAGHLVHTASTRRLGADAH
ncbi:MAG: hypothetical protein Q4G43_00085 [Mobilicoccus sp.]|nr:hypothetical protein [Mobilicoccus sp.]